MDDTVKPVIEAAGLCKSYRIWKDESSRLASPMLDAASALVPIPALRRRMRERAGAMWRDFFALQGIDLSVPRGQCLGIVGRNGSGKSTLLQILCGVLRPSAGSVDVRGRIAALLELGSGFNPDFTGKENVFLNAAILGLGREEVRSRYDEIVRFADIGDFVEQPVRTYSSGMMLRLAFAVQVLVDPDVLVVDEALSVGDEPFQRKCFARMEKLREAGVTILFVSHDMAPVMNLCDRAILLHRGRLMLDGPPRLVTSVYQRFNHAPAARAEELLAELCSDAGSGQAPVVRDKPATVDEPAHPEHFDPALQPQTTSVYDELGARIGNVRIVDEDGYRVNILRRRGTYAYRYRVDFQRDCEGVNFAMLIKTLMGVELGGARTLPASKPVAHVPAGSEFEVEFRFRCLLTPGAYCMNAGVEAVVDGRPSYATRVLDAQLFKVRPEPDLIPTVTVDFDIEPSFRQA